MGNDLNDWDLLNAHADGELNTVDAESLCRRMAVEPTLAREFERVRDLKRQLSLPKPPESVIPPKAASPLRRTRNAAAIAAGLALVVVAISASLLWWSDEATWLAQAETLHDRLSQTAYVIEERHVTRIVSSGRALEVRAPDLTASRLFLVDVTTSRLQDRESLAMHYRGLRGCRLSILAIEAMADRGDVAATADDGKLIQTWHFGEFNFAIIADGMDRQRFASIADYAKAVMLENARERRDLRFAMADHYRIAKPCA